MILAETRDFNDGFLADYPLVARYVTERYRDAGTIDVDEEPRLRVFVNAQRQPTRQHARLGLPCFH